MPNTLGACRDARGVGMIVGAMLLVTMTLKRPWPSNRSAGTGRSVLTAETMTQPVLRPT